MPAVHMEELRALRDPLTTHHHQESATGEQNDRAHGQAERDKHVRAGRREVAIARNSVICGRA